MHSLLADLGTDGAADEALEPAHGFFFGDSGVGDAVEMALEQLLFVGPRELAIPRQPLVMVVRDVVEEIFLEVGAGAADTVNLPLADHLRQGHAELRRAHGARERDQHLAAGVEVLHVGLRRVDERRAVEVPVVVPNEIGDRAHRVRT